MPGDWTRDLTHTTMRGCDVDLHVVRAGAGVGAGAGAGTDGSGPAVILLHGFPENWTSWRHQIQPLVDAGFSVLVPDMRGYNRSERPPGVADYRMRMLIEDVNALVLALPERRAHIVGHDWGGVVAWTFAGAYPERTLRLTVMNAPHPLLFSRALRKPFQMFKSWYIAMFQIPGLAERILSRNNYKRLRSIFRNGPAIPGTFSDDDIQNYVEAASHPGALTAMLNYYRAAREPGGLAIARASRPECETLVIWGDQDRALSVRLLKNIEEVAPLVRIRRIPESGHWVQNEAPEKVNKLLLEFLLEPPEQARYNR